MGGRFEEQHLVDETRWTIDRTRVAMDNMIIRDGLCWVDEQDDARVSYWVPSAMVWDE